MAIPGSEFVGDELQINHISQKQNGAGDIGLANRIKMDTIIALTDLEQLTTKRDVLALTGAGGATFSVTFPITYSTAVGASPDISNYFNSIPTIIIREMVSTGVYRFRTDIQPTYDSTANTLTIDEPPFTGDITFKL